MIQSRKRSCATIGSRGRMSVELSAEWPCGALLCGKPTLRRILCIGVAPRSSPSPTKTPRPATSGRHHALVRSPFAGATARPSRGRPRPCGATSRAVGHLERWARHPLGLPGPCVTTKDRVFGCAVLEPSLVVLVLTRDGPHIDRWRVIAQMPEIEQVHQVADGWTIGRYVLADALDRIGQVVAAARQQRI